MSLRNTVMKLALKKFCLHRGCTTLVDSGYCELHTKDKQKARQQYDANRPAWHDMYNNDRWRRARIRYLKQHPLCECEECKKNNRILAANVVDHRKPHKGDYELFWDEDNWMAMTKKCHDRKTAKEDGGFGNLNK